MERPGPAERHQREVARIVAALDRDHPRRQHHVGVDDRQDAQRGLDRVHAERAGNVLLDRAPGGLGVDLHLAAEDALGIEALGQDVGIADRGQRAAAPVAGWTRHRPGAARPDLQGAARIDPADGAAAGPLGPREVWPQSLRTSVSICLASRFPILIWWGPGLVKLYNDAYASILADKHPRALGAPGREVWPEIWDIIGPMLTGVQARGEATWSDDQMLPLRRKGYTEECYFTFSYSP